MLISRPDGKEAFLAASAYLLKDVNKNELIEIDFSEVQVLTPGWADEVVTKIADKFNNVKLLNTKNPSVKASLEILREYSDLKI